MKKTIITIIIIILIAGIFTALGFAFPIYAPMLPLLFIMFVIDGYLFNSVRHTIFGLRSFWKYLAFVLYWLPVILLLGCIIAGAFVPFIEWNIPVRTILPGLIFVFFVFKILPFLFLLIADIARIFSFGIRSYLHSGTRFHEVERVKWLPLTGWVTGTLFLLLLLIGMFFWNYDFQVRKQEIILPELPASFEGLTIVQISDIHLGGWARKAELSRAVDLVNAQHPDIIFFTGDMANYTTLDVLPFEKILANLKAPDGIFTILGNHDYGAYVKWPSEEAKAQDMKDLERFYQRLGWILLLNEHSILRRGNDSIVILGVQNWGKAYRFQKLGDIPAARKGVEDMKVQLLLSHDPSFWDSIICHKYRNIDVTFSGHTHAFQFGIECCGIRWSPAQYLYDQWAGLYAKPVPGSHPQYIYVNRGLGSLGYPGRIGELPEITVFTLRRR
ncbi:MAG: metallophosphoesterase [Bacteroidetes bacterium]|nr:metallophosphoesterase [Bacteroidota bacterium]